jgi:eukaryotic-like serine/threonine-protein kinase
LGSLRRLLPCRLHTSLIDRGPKVYFGATDGFLYALDRSRGTLVWKLAFGEPIHASPVFASGRPYIQTRDGRLHVME